MLVSVLYKSFFLVVLSLSFLYAAPSSAQQAPSFSLQGDKGQISLKKYRGKVVYVDFWASWCVPCRKSFPWMNEMHKKYQSDGLVVLGINLDDTRKAAKSFLKQVPADFVVAYDPEGVTPGKYQVEVMPTSYLVDRTGKLVFSHKGFKKSQAHKVEDKIKALLGK